MKITIVFDNCQGRPELKYGWGFSALIEASGFAPLLFDTGIDGSALLHNLNVLGIDPARIGIIVISHDHADHSGALKYILEVNREAEIYVPASFSGRLLGRKVTAVTAAGPVCQDIFTTGELQGIELSLALKTSKGIVVITGCSHPGIDQIFDAASRFGEICGIIGGLHNCRNVERLRGLSLICPCHCTQYKSELKDLYPDKYLACEVGLELSL